MVSKITEKIVNSLLDKKNFKSGNRDSVITNNNISTYYLYNTKLFELYDRHLTITPNGYYTNTTSKRLNQIISLLTHNKYNIKGIKGIYYLFMDGFKFAEIGDIYTLTI
jgi:hypothetical protein